MFFFSILGKWLISYYYIQSGTFKWFEAQNSLHLLQFLIASRRQPTLTFVCWEFVKLTNLSNVQQYLTRDRPGSVWRLVFFAFAICHKVSAVNLLAIIHNNNPHKNEATTNNKNVMAISKQPLEIYCLASSQCSQRSYEVIF